LYVDTVKFAFVTVKNNVVNIKLRKYIKEKYACLYIERCSGRSIGVCLN